MKQMIEMALFTIKTLRVARLKNIFMWEIYSIEMNGLHKSYKPMEYGHTFRWQQEIYPCGMFIELGAGCSPASRLNEHCFVRIPCIRPVYLGCASPKMGEDSLKVWYGMVLM